MNALVFLVAITVPGADPGTVTMAQPAPLSSYSTGETGAWSRWRENHPGLLARLRGRFGHPSSSQPLSSTSVSAYPGAGARSVTVNEPPLAPGSFVAPGPLVAPGAVSMPTSSYGYRP